LSFTALLWPLARALGVFLLLQAVYVLLRRGLPSFRPRTSYQLWVGSMALFAALSGTAWGAWDATPWRIAVTLVAIFTTVIGFALFEGLFLARPRKAAQASLMPKLARDVLRVVLLLAVILAVARLVFDYDPGKLFVGSTAVAAIVGLALQDVLKDVFAGMTIQLERSVQRGDWLLWDGTPSQVVDMTFRATHLRNNEHELVIVPNSQLAMQPIKNLGNGNQAVALPLTIGLPYDVPPLVVKNALEEATASAEATVQEPVSRAYLREYGDSAIIYKIRAWTRSQHQLTSYRDEVLTRIWYRLQREGISIPFPIRTVHFHNQDRRDAHATTEARQRAGEMLAAVPLFEELPALALRALAAFARRRHYDHGEVLVREGERGTSLFLIDKGEVRIVKGATPETEVDLALLGPGDFFGEHSLLTGEPRGATVRAIGGCEVLILDREALAPVLANDPQLAESLSKALADRDAATMAKLEGRRTADTALAASRVSVLRKIRSFFSLPDA
jgi:small-conductance mechanosensitive channel/CRP-like cAMP-binding protein